MSIFGPLLAWWLALFGAPPAFLCDGDFEPHPICNEADVPRGKARPRLEKGANPPLDSGAITEISNGF